MFVDRAKKKAKRPPKSGGDASLDVTDLRDQVPKIDDILGEVDKALEEAKVLAEKVKPRQRCCGCCWDDK